MKINRYNQIPEGYPSKLTDDDLVEAIKECSKFYIGGAGATAQVWLQAIQIGQNELAIRTQKKFSTKVDDLNNEISSLKENNQKFSKRTTWLSVLTIILAACTVAFAVFNFLYARIDMKSDEAWQKQQIELLEEQNRINLEFNLKIETLLEKQEIPVEPILE